MEPTRSREELARITASRAFALFAALDVSTARKPRADCVTVYQAQDRATDQERDCIHHSVLSA